MYYFRCPTCGTCFADKYIPLEKELKNICKKTKDTNERDKKQSELLSTLEINNICCRQRLITYVDMESVIN